MITYAISPYARNEKLFSSIIAKRGIELFRGDPNGCGNNYGWSAGYDFIGLSHFDDPDIELIAFFHELAHIENAHEMSRSKNEVHLCTLSNEGAAWEKAFCLAANHGYRFDYYSHVREWARDQLKTYLLEGTNSHTELFKNAVYNDDNSGYNSHSDSTGATMQRKLIEDRIMQFITADMNPEAEVSTVQFNSMRWRYVAEVFSGWMGVDTSTKDYRRSISSFAIRRQELSKLDDITLLDFLVLITRRAFMCM